jgi:hypothetical protein
MVRPLTVLSLCLCLGATGLRAGEDVVRTNLRLKIFPAEAFVSETVWITPSHGTGELVLAEAPAELVAASLIVRAKNPALLIVREVHLQIDRSQTNRAAVFELKARVESASDRPEPVEISYRTGNIGWSAQYRTTWRASLAEAEKLYLDFSCLVAVTNNTGCRYDDAEIRLIGPDAAAERADDQPGMIYLEPNNPLRPLIEQSPHAEAPEHTYEAPGRHSLPPGSVSGLTLVKVLNCPARWRYRLSSAEAPLSAGSQTYALESVVEIDNTVRTGLGLPLPPGRLVAEGAPSVSRVLRSSRLSFSPANGVLRIPFGRSANVRGRRERLSREFIGAGQMEDRYEITVNNRLTVPAALEVYEEPRYSYPRRFRSVSREAEQGDRWLRFLDVLPARGEWRAQYTVLVSEKEAGFLPDRGER